MKQGLTRTMLTGLVLASPVLAGGLFRVWVHQEAVQLGYRLSEAEHESRKLEGLLRQLEVELAAARSPENLQRLAKELGMRPPTPSEVMTLKPQAGTGKGR